MPFIRLLVLIMCIATPVLAQDGTIATDTGTSQIELDAAIATRIREIVDELDDYDDVTIVVNAGIVTLRGTTLEADGYERLGALVERVAGVVAIKNEVTTSTAIVERISPAMERFKTRVGQVVAFLPLILVAGLAFVAVVSAGFVLARQNQPWNRLGPNAFIADIYRTLVRLAFIIFGVLVALDILGATALLSTILGAAGIIGLALGFAVRDTVENFIASLLLSVRQPFRPNDTIEIGGDIGKVIRLTSRATILLSFDGNHIRIPNATVFKSRIINYTRNHERRFQFSLVLEPDMDPGVAETRGLDRLATLPFVLEKPAPSVWIDKMDGDGVTLCFSGWIDQHDSHFDHARGEAMRLVRDALNKPARKGAKIPEARDVSAQLVGADDAALDSLAETDRAANQDSDLLTRDGMDE